ncbi:MAG: VWA domain-containing protein [Acidobacteriota bacterium]
MTSPALAHPWVLWFLLGLPVIGVWRWRRNRRLVPWPAAQLDKPPRGQGLGELASLAAELLLLACALLGAAGPYRSSHLELSEARGIDVTLVLDISLSMLAEDFEPNRLEVLRRVAADFVARSGEHRIGVVVFAKDALVQTPLTTDHGSLLSLLEAVTVYVLDQEKSGGTALGDALLVAAEGLEAARIDGRDQAVVLITDGESNAGIDPLLAARYLESREIRLYAIGIGGTEPVQVMFKGAPVGGDNPYLASLDDAQLRALVADGRGRYFRALDGSALEQIFQELSRLESAPLELRRVEIRHPWTTPFAATCGALFLCHLLMRGLWLRRPYR